MIEIEEQMQVAKLQTDDGRPLYRVTMPLSPGREIVMYMVKHPSELTDAERSHIVDSLRPYVVNKENNV